MNLKELGESLGLEEDEFIEIVEIFLETAYLDISRLEDAFGAQSSEGVSEAAHSLKGSAGNLGFSEISSLSGAIESKARKNDISGLDLIIPELVSRLNAIKTLL